MLLVYKHSNNFKNSFPISLEPLFIKEWDWKNDEIIDVYRSRSDLRNVLDTIEPSDV